MIIEEGKYYKTAEGDVFGPMEIWMESADHKFQERDGSFRLSKGGDIWRDDGTSEYVSDLIAEVAGK